MGSLRRIRAGEPITEDFLNEIADRLERGANLTVAPSGYLRMFDGPDGKHLVLAYPRPIWAQLSGSSSPYTYTEVQPAAGGTWTTLGSRTGTNAYEINGLSGLNGKVVSMKWTSAGDWRFNFRRFGTTTCSPGTAQICATILDDGCGTPLGTGATITVKDAGGTTIGTCTTTGTVTALSLVSGGTGYTNGTGYALIFSGGGGSGASGTFDVVGGIVQNLQLTAGGSGYTSAPSLSFTNGGAGTGAGGTATVQERCCIAISSSGTYTVTSDIPGTATKTSTITATCSLGNNVNFSYASNTLGKLCFNCTTCNNSGSTNISGATIVLSGTGSATLTTPASGSVCVKVGVGTYSAAVTFPSGFTTTQGSIAVSACSTTTVNIGTVTGMSGNVRTDADQFTGTCGCVGTVTIKDSGTGTTLGTTTMAASTPFGTLGCIASYSMTITETLLTTPVDYSIVYPSLSGGSTGVPLSCPTVDFDLRQTPPQKAC